MVFIVFGLAFILILKGGDLLVESAINFSYKTKIPSMVVGATIVAIATTMPEMSVSVASGISGDSGLAVSTAVGSMMCNFALVLGISFLIFPSTVGTRGLMGKVSVFLLAVLVLFFVGLDGVITFFDSVVLSLVFILNIILSVIESKKYNETIVLTESQDGWFKIITQFILASFAVGFGANVLVSNVEELSVVLGVSESIIGMFIISVGTNIPELVTTISAIKLKDSEIGLGNIFGASIIDSTLLVVVTVLSSEGRIVQIPSPLLFVTVPSLFIITMLIALPIIKNSKSSRFQGCLLLILFVVYSLILAKIS